MNWTDERVEKLKKLWSEGLSASQIAAQLGGVSRNAVIGKAHRLGLKSRPSPVKAGDDAPAKPAPKAAPRPAAPKPAVARPRNEEPAAPPRPPVDRVPAPTPAPAPRAAQPPVPATGDAPKPDGPKLVSIGPGGFIRQGPGDQQAPIPPAPPRRRVPAKPSADIADKTSLLDLNDRICRWPMGHPGEPDFHFCGQPVNPGYPYCVEHCGRAFQAQLPRGTRRPPPPPPFGGPRVR